jgi:hypothetical protein
LRTAFAPTIPLSPQNRDSGANTILGIQGIRNER